MPTDPSQAFAEAAAHYHAGRLAESERACRLVLQHDAGYAPAWNLLGVIACSAGAFELALSYFASAIAASPREADYYANQGLAYQSLGSHASALASYRQALALHSAVASTHDNLGNCLHELNRYDEAVASHLRAIELEPGFATAHNNLGNSYLAQGQVAEALASYRRALALAPEDASAHNNLGTALLRQGELDDATRHLECALALSPRLADAYNNLGVVCKQQGDLPRAARLFQQTLELRPRYEKALNNLGTVLMMLGQPQAAADCFRQAVEQTPGSAENHDRLGNALRIAGRLDEARHWLARALELNPALASAHANLGAAWHAAGDLDHAVACYRRALEFDPRLAFAHTSLAQALIALGENEAAAAHLARAIEAEPEHALAYWLLAAQSSQPLPEPTVRKLEHLLAGGRQTEEERTWLHFALAQSFDKAGDYERAMSQARSANGLKQRLLQQRGLSFDPAAHARLIDAALARYTPQFFAAARGLGTDSDLPLFIVGMPRSGTTLVEQILASHSRVHGAGELDDAERLETELGGVLAAGLARAGQFTEGEIARARGLAEAHLQKLARLGGTAVLVVDKMPKNFLHLGAIAALFPQARVIHCIRDPRDVLLSCYFQNFSADVMNFSFDWDHLTHYWRQYERLMEHWRSVLPLPIHQVSYEELVRDQEGVSRRLVEWCGLAWDPGCLDFHQTPRQVATASAAQVREPIYSHAIARWRNYDPHLDWPLGPSR